MGIKRITQLTLGTLCASMVIGYTCDPQMGSDYSKCRQREEEQERKRKEIMDEERRYEREEYDRRENERNYSPCGLIRRRTY